jgi:hypothetical protein
MQKYDNSVGTETCSPKILDETVVKKIVIIDEHNQSENSC